MSRENCGDPGARSEMSPSRRLRPDGIEDSSCRNLRHHHPRHFRIKPANAVAANDEIGWIENMTSDTVSLWLRRHSDRAKLVDVWRKRVDYPELKAAVQNQAARFRAQCVPVEVAGAGTSLVQELRSKVSRIIAVRPDGDKVSRMAVVSAKFEAGQVFLPERASWLADFEAELFAFPGSRNDDQCDSVSQALSEQNVRFPLNISPETVARLRQRKRGTRIEYCDASSGRRSARRPA
jgi:predicted phage terminase large subunit-like protein